MDLSSSELYQQNWKVEIKGQDVLKYAAFSMHTSEK